MTQANTEKFYEEIKKYPPTLRKLALHILKSDQYKPLRQYAKECGLNPKVVEDLVYQNRKKGKDFNELLSPVYSEKLGRFRPGCFKSLVREALKGSAKHLELYFRLTGDLRQDPRDSGNTTTNNLTFVLAMPASIEPKEIEPPKEVIDVDPARDREKEMVKFQFHKCPLCGDKFDTLSSPTPEKYK